MPFTPLHKKNKKGQELYKSKKSGKTYTDKQVKMYYATDGFKNMKK